MSTSLSQSTARRAFWPAAAMNKVWPAYSMTTWCTGPLSKRRPVPAATLYIDDAPAARISARS
jgi:hypothetical protein